MPESPSREPCPDLDALADILTIAICLEAFGRLGITTTALDLAAEAVLASDAFEGGLT